MEIQQFYYEIVNSETIQIGNQFFDIQDVSSYLPHLERLLNSKYVWVDELLRFRDSRNHIYEGENNNFRFFNFREYEFDISEIMYFIYTHFDNVYVEYVAYDDGVIVVSKNLLNLRQIERRVYANFLFPKLLEMNQFFKIWDEDYVKSIEIFIKDYQ